MYVCMYWLRYICMYVGVKITPVIKKAFGLRRLIRMLQKIKINKIAKWRNQIEIEEFHKNNK